LLDKGRNLNERTAAALKSGIDTEMAFCLLSRLMQMGRWPFTTRPTGEVQSFNNVSCWFNNIQFRLKKKNQWKWKSNEVEACQNGHAGAFERGRCLAHQTSS